MAGSLTSDSSRTLSAANNPPHSAMNGSSSSLLIKALSNSQHEFLQPKSSLHSAALVLAKKYLDPLAASVAGGKKSEVLEKIYLDGFDVDQVWEQARLVVDAVESGVGGGGGVSRGVNGDAKVGEFANGKKRKAVAFEEDIDSASGTSSQSDSEEDEEEDDDEDLGEEEYEEPMDEDGGIALPDDDDEEEGIEEDPEEGGEEFVQDVHGLNDGFFSIDDFNRQTRLLEMQDERGELGSDEEEIDYDADPDQLADNDEVEDEGGIVTIGNDDYDEEDGDMHDSYDNSNGIMYQDFFAPPAKKGSKKRLSKVSKPWNQRTKRLEEELEREGSNIESEMARVRRDLFDDDVSEEGSDFDMDDDPANPISHRSTHEKRQATIIEQIRQLEAANVAKKQWTLAGEARSTTRPLNSLLEEDLDFERSGKPVPVITQEVTEDLEEMIKRRIIASDFDEVIRRRPDDISSRFHRGRIELDDSKPQQGLAEIYEREHLQKIDPENNPDIKDEKLAEAHREIGELFSDVSRKLDALSSWHFTPKPPKPAISIVVDAPAISMEEAQPSAADGGALAANISMLAPQEVYAPQKGRVVATIGEGGGREIVGKSGAPVSTREMTREDKQRRRRREKEKIKKRNLGEGNKGGEVKEGSRKDVRNSLKKGRVKVIGEGGEKRDVDGNLVKDKGGGTKSSFLKL
ncbi:U3 small nucleolar ribonucleoprotein complex, subunit Mpp10 [Tuber indicum]|nr:U3 small nucleolar ribonucleoprotein complex, subunit Mpp10 [Tuber indicum]